MADDGQDLRTRLMDLSIALVEDVRHEGAQPDSGLQGFSANFQVCLPYRGLFVWHVGDDDVVGDANQLLFVRGAESYRLSGPVEHGFAELVITPDLDVLAEIAYVHARHLFSHPLFRRRVWRADAHLQSFRARFLHWARTAERNDLEAEEVVLHLLRAALQQDDRRAIATGRATARLIRRAKEFLEARLSSRILLTDVARAVESSPAYLTDLFRRVEGVSLHQYLRQLRLARALVELPHAGDLTALSFELGFSSHSHFSYAFRRAFGCTPSEFRRNTHSLHGGFTPFIRA